MHRKFTFIGKRKTNLETSTVFTTWLFARLPVNLETYIKRRWHTRNKNGENANAAT